MPLLSILKALCHYITSQIPKNNHRSRGEVVVNYLIFACILYSKQIKLPRLLAIEPEPKTLAKLYQRPNIRLNSTAVS